MAPWMRKRKINAASIPKKGGRRRKGRRGRRKRRRRRTRGTKGIWREGSRRVRLMVRENEEARWNRTSRIFLR